MWRIGVKLSARSILQIKKIDLHIHTKFSDGSCTAEEVEKTAERKGLKIIAITDHYNEFQNQKKRMVQHQLLRYLQTLNGLNVLKGVEAEILQDGTVSISEKNADLLDIIIGGLHSFNGVFFWGDKSPIWNSRIFVEGVRVALINAMESGLLDIIAHVTWLPEAVRKETQKLITNSWIDSIVDAANDFGVVIELNGAWKVPDERFVYKCLRSGVKLSIGSDAHHPSMIGKVGYPVEILKRLDVPEDLIFIPKGLL
jgi:histidinol phosphatase-like PHP family hydrolase